MSTTAAKQGWFKSSHSNQSSSCVEVRFSDDLVLIRDSKYLRDPNSDPAVQPVISVPAVLWPTFLGRALGQIDDATAGLPKIDRHADGSVTLRSNDGIQLEYNASEWIAYTDGISDGEFAAA